MDIHSGSTIFARNKEHKESSMIKPSRFSYLLCASLSFWTQDAWSQSWSEWWEGLRNQKPGQTALSANNEGTNQTEDPPLARCDLMGDHAVADWLNCINIGSFFNASSKYILNHDQCFVFFNPSENISLWAEPYGFYSHYQSGLKKDQKMDFTLASFGSDIAAQFSLTDQINMGVGAGYFYSNLHDKTDNKSSKINGVYFGPAVEYLFSEASAALSLFAVKNFYDAPKEASESSWDINLRLEGEYDYAPPSDFCIREVMAHPYARIDYLNVFEQKKERHSSFFYSKLGSRFDKVAYSSDSGIITANIDISWINMTPLTGDSQKCDDGTFDIKPNSKNQLGAGLAVVGMHNNGLLISLEYDAAVGANAPMQTGRVRIEWNW